MSESRDILKKISSLAKRRGFIYQSSEIYGGISGMWDYGPAGVELKRNIKNQWWETMVQKRDDVVGADGSIIMNPKVWEASGHLESFTDPLVECKKCHKRFRADHLQEDTDKGLENIDCPECGGELTDPKNFNLMVGVMLGSVEGEKRKAYLRGEITQGAHVNFKQVVNSTRVDIPFGIAQIGKAFRNEITPSKLSFRSREFEQMELQFYVLPEKAEKWMKKWKKERMSWYVELGLNEDKLRFRQHGDDEKAHYAQDAWDIEYNLGDEWLEFEGIHNRGDWDVSRHQEYSGEDFTIQDKETGEKYLPYIVETSGGVDRAALFFLVDAYTEEEMDNGKTRTVMKFDPRVAPCKAAVFPLLSNKPKLVKKARSIYENLKEDMMVYWDDRGNIGKRYRYQDEIGTPFCITVDFDSLEDDAVTVRDRDSMKQDRINIEDLSNYLQEKIK